jgi:hypothetical protein
MYRIYYLTSDKDFNMPMYVGMTKLLLKDRLKNHLSHTKKHSKINNWKKSVNNVRICLIEDGIQTFEECSSAELGWINFWKKINPELKNSIFYKLSDNPYKNSIENIRKNISEGVRRKRCKDVIVLDLNGNFVGEFPTIKEASLNTKIKEETISLILKNKSKASKLIFIYKDEYVEGLDYSHKVYFAKNRNPCKIKPVVSENCRNKRKISCVVKNTITGEVFNFSSQQKACDYFGFSSSLYSRNKKSGKLYKGTYKFE